VKKGLKELNLLFIDDLLLSTRSSRSQASSAHIISFAFFISNPIEVNSYFWIAEDWYSGSTLSHEDQ